MKNTDLSPLPRRITDLIEQKKQGRAVICLPSFEILPVDFLHRENPYKAYIFLCRFNGLVDDKTYSFRKCYARGCPHNQCVHVSQAVLIANRYLQRDYSRLAQAGIQVYEQLFTLEEMILKFDDYKNEQGAPQTLEECLELAQRGAQVELNVNLEYVPAVEHFSNHKNSQTFLTADFTVTVNNEKHSFQRCLSCFQTDKETEEKALQIEVANARLKTLYQMLSSSSVKHTETFFV